MNTIYELTDSTSDETYYTQGLFSTIILALGHAMREDAPKYLTYAEEYASLTVKKRPVDVADDACTEVAVVHWHQPYDEDIDDSPWKIHRIITRPKHLNDVKKACEGMDDVMILLDNRSKALLSERNAGVAP